MSCASRHVGCLVFEIVYSVAIPDSKPPSQQLWTPRICRLGCPKRSDPIIRMSQNDAPVGLRRGVFVGIEARQWQIHV